MSIRWAFTLLFLCSTAWAESGFEATAKLVGSYKGEWSAYAMDAQGNIFEKSKWVDALVEANPVDDKERPTVEATNTVTFPNGKIIVSHYLEGFYTDENGEASDRYTINHDVITTYTCMDRDSWVFQYRLNDEELVWLGFDPSLVTSASHVIVRSRTFAADGKETYSMTRVTTVHWHTQEGVEQVRQFVSLKGYHQRER